MKKVGGFMHGEIIMLLSIFALGVFGAYLWSASENAAYKKAVDAYKDLQSRVGVLEEELTQLEHFRSELNQLADEVDQKKESVLKVDGPIQVEVKEKKAAPALSKEEMDAVRNLRAKKKAKELLKDSAKKIKALSR